jgi:pyruvate/2-oxoglutarate/acetoin dehydrogenase E1 component
VIDTPVSENAITGTAVGAALVGMRPVVVHPRVDFMMYAMDPVINEAANWHYMFGGQMSVPLVIRLIIGRGWGQGPQHSQSLQAWFAHVPGLKVVMPATPHDAKGLLISSIEDNNPVIFLILTAFFFNFFNLQKISHPEIIGLPLAISLSAIIQFLIIFLLFNRKRDAVFNGNNK